MALHRRRKGETVAQERSRVHRKDTVAGRASKRRNVGARTRRGK